MSLFDHNIDSQTFNTWAEYDLIPKLPPDSVLVMANAAFHKSQCMQHKVKDKGHMIEYLPPYSPDLNPVEQK